ncbi:MAG: response regulator [Hymenobacter sp.]|nr:MAG: response regulator [Hymenobacter sp.]
MGGWHRVGLCWAKRIAMLENPSKIFLVDDDPFCRQLMEHAIRGLGFSNVQAFDNGASCLDALIEEPEIIFLDQMMGSVSGTDALKAIKRFNPDIYVVLVSGQQQVQVAVDSLKYGAFDYVVKDEQLTDRLTSVLAKIAQVQELLASRQKAKPRFLSLFSL